MSVRLRNFLKNIIPERFHPYPLFEAAILRASKGRVLSGPFAGTCWIEGNIGSYLLPRVLGTYERELHSSLMSLAGAKFENICIVGAGEGYYVGGLGRMFPLAAITAFESDERGREIVSRVAERNKLDAITVRGHCATAELREAISGKKVLIVMDIEGGEMELLDPEALPALKSAAIIVETHEAYRPGVAAALRERFRDSHTIAQVEPSKRTIGEFPLFWGRAVSFLDWRYPQWAMAEGRPEGIFWMILNPKT